MQGKGNKSTEKVGGLERKLIGNYYLPTLLLVLNKVLFQNTQKEIFLRNPFDSNIVSWALSNAKTACFLQRSSTNRGQADRSNDVLLPIISSSEGGPIQFLDFSYRQLP